MSALTQLATVKSRLSITDTSYDTLLTRIINAVSARFEMYCNREFGRQDEATAEFSADETEIRVPVFPVESVAAFALKTSEGDGWATLDTMPEYVIGTGGVICLALPLGTRLQRGRVTYAGGYVLPGDEVKDGQTSLPEDIQNACIEQVAYWYSNRSNLGVVKVSSSSSTTTQYSQLEMLASVSNTLDAHKRLAV